MIEKPILALETSDILCGCTIYYNDQKYFSSEIVQRNSHSEKVFDLIDEALKNSKIHVNDLGALAISSGPGSFTGLRIGYSAIKGLAVGADLPVVAVPTFDAFALMVNDFVPENTEYCICGKVNIDEVYYSKYISGEEYKVIEEVNIILRKELEEKVKSTLMFGNLKDEKVFRTPNSLYVAKWAKLYGQLTKDYDFLEPNYLKNFVVKGKHHD